MTATYRDCTTCDGEGEVGIRTAVSGVGTDGMGDVECYTCEDCEGRGHNWEETSAACPEEVGDE